MTKATRLKNLVIHWVFQNVISGIKFYDKQNCEKLEHIW